MNISIISDSNSYSSVSNTGAQSNVEQLKLEEQKLQKELQQLKTSSSNKSNQTKEKALEQEISKIKQEIQQAGNRSATSNAQSSTEAGSLNSSFAEDSDSAKLNILV